YRRTGHRDRARAEDCTGAIPGSRRRPLPEPACASNPSSIMASDYGSGERSPRPRALAGFGARRTMTAVSIALVQDWLEAPGGGEAVLAELLRMYPGADVYALVDFLSPSERMKIGVSRVTTSSLQRMPAARRWFRYAALLRPTIIERFDLSRYDLLISDSHAIAKGVRKRGSQVHVCYCYTPARFAWTMATTYRARAADRARSLPPPA